MPEPTTPATPAPTAPVTTPPAAPASAATTPPATPTVDPFLKKFVESAGMALGDDITMKPLPPEGPQAGEPQIVDIPGRTLGEMAKESFEKDKVAKEKIVADAAAGTATPPPEATATTATTATTPAAPAPDPAAPVKPIEVRRPAVDELATRVTKDVLAEVRKLQTPAPATPTAPAAPAAPSAEEQWEAALPEENREMLELLRWGEANGVDALKGKAAEQSAYFRRLEDFARTNPEEDALSEWMQKNKPAIAERAIRKAAEGRLLKQAREEAVDEVRRENEPRMAEVEARQRAAEIRPMVEAAANDFARSFEVDVEGDKTKVGTPRIPSAVAKKIRAYGIEAAMEEYPMEAPIVHQFATAARALLDLRHGLAAYDPSSDAHKFLDQFIIRQEQAYLAKPENERIVNGKTFLPASVYYKALNDDPTVAQRYSTFSDRNLLDMMEESAHRAVNRKYQQLEKAGYVRKSAAPATPTAADVTKPQEQPAAAAPAAPPSTEGEGVPRAGASKAPGAATPTNEINPNLAFLKKIHPDAERILASP